MSTGNISKPIKTDRNVLAAIHVLLLDFVKHEQKLWFDISPLILLMKFDMKKGSKYLWNINFETGLQAPV